MRWPTLVLSLLAACDFSRADGSATPDGSGPTVDDVDAPSSVCPTSFSALVDTCTATFGPAVTLASGPDEYRYDTDTHALESCTGGDCEPIDAPTNAVVDGIEVWLVQSFTLAAQTRLVVSGSRPFAIVAPMGITLSSAIEMEAGARTAAQCGAAAGQNGTSNGNGGGGGGGGGFQRAGQKGGDGTGGGGTGGATQAMPATLVGGCPGGDGGGSPNNGEAGAAGGGAIHLASSASVVISATSGRINAGGRGGRGARSNNGKGGGSGGGSGGMIWIQTADLQLAGQLAVNGGGGGEGTSGSNDGSNGSRGDFTLMAAKGGKGSDSNGGDGGDGDASDVATTTAGKNDESGGGGGGGVGYIRLVVGARNGNGTMSPPPL